MTPHFSGKLKNITNSRLFAKIASFCLPFVGGVFLCEIEPPDETLQLICLIKAKKGILQGQKIEKLKLSQRDPNQETNVFDAHFCGPSCDAQASIWETSLNYQNQFGGYTN